MIALIAGGTLIPFTRFAFGQSRLPVEIAGGRSSASSRSSGALAGAVVFGNPAGLASPAGGAAILGGVALSSLRRPRAVDRPSRP